MPDGRLIEKNPAEKDDRSKSPSQQESQDGVNRIVPNRLIIQGLRKTTTGDISRQIHPTDIFRETSPEIIYQERLFFARHCATFL